MQFLQVVTHQLAHLHILEVMPAPFVPRVQVGRVARQRLQPHAVAYMDPGSSGMLGDGTSFNAPTPAAWYVLGWFKVDANKATQAISGDLQNRYYYF